MLTEYAKYSITQLNIFLANNVNCILDSCRGSKTSRSREIIHFLNMDEAMDVPGLRF